MSNKNKQKKKQKRKNYYKIKKKKSNRTMSDYLTSGAIQRSLNIKSELKYNDTSVEQIWTGDLIAFSN